MSLTVATLIPGILLLLLGLPLVLGHTGYAAMLKALPRSARASYVFFTAGAAWFLYIIAHLRAGDEIVPKAYIFAFVLAIAVGSMIYMREFLAVRGLSILVLLGAMPLLDAAYMEYDRPQRLLMVSVVYLAITLAIWLGGQPWRLRDFIAWLYARPGRARGVGGAVAVYGLVLCGVAFTY